MLYQFIHRASLLNFSLGLLMAGLGSVMAAQASTTSYYIRHPSGTDDEKNARKAQAQTLLVGNALGATFLLTGSIIFLVSGGIAAGWYEKGLKMKALQ